MNKRAFRRALRYGFGRAILHLQQHDSTPYRDDILDGCLHFWGYDGDFDTDRPEYIFEIISLTGEREFYRNRILNAVETETDDHDLRQLLTLVRLFAEVGDDEARQTLDRALQRMPFDELLTEREIVREGPQGLLRIVQSRLACLAPDGETDVDISELGWVLRDAQGHWGKRAFTEVMSVAGQQDPRIATIWKQIQKEARDSAKKPRDRYQEPILSYEQVNEVLKNPGIAKSFGGSSPTSTLRNWSKVASDADWQRLCERMATLPLDDIQWRRALRYLFDRRAFVGEPNRFIASVKAFPLGANRPATFDDSLEELPRYALNALALIRHPDVRSLALELLAISRWTSHAAALLVTNYVDGDLQVLAHAFRRERREWQRHGMGISISRIDCAYAPPDAPDVLRMLYENVRCGHCRHDFVTRLHEYGALPASIAEECRYDANFDLRTLIAELAPDA